MTEENHAHRIMKRISTSDVYSGTAIGENVIQACILQEERPSMKPMVSIIEQSLGQNVTGSKAQEMHIQNVYISPTSQVEADCGGSPNCLHGLVTNMHELKQETNKMMEPQTTRQAVADVTKNLGTHSEFCVENSVCEVKGNKNESESHLPGKECDVTSDKSSGNCSTPEMFSIFSSEAESQKVNVENCLKAVQASIEGESLRMNSDESRSFNSEVCLRDVTAEEFVTKCDPELVNVWTDDDVNVQNMETAKKVIGDNCQMVFVECAQSESKDERIFSDACEVKHKEESKMDLPDSANNVQSSAVPEGEADINDVIDSNGETRASVFLKEEKKFNVQYLSGNVKRGQRMLPGTWRKSRRRKKCSRERRNQKMRKECMVPGCFTRACSSRFVEFPLDPGKRHEWALKTRLNEKFPDVDPLVPLPLRIGLCMAHFLEDDFHVVPRGESRLCSLKENIDPSVFPWVEGYASLRNGMDIFKKDKGSREAKLLSVMKSELDNMLNPPNRSEFIVNTYQQRRTAVPPLKIRLKACVESARMKKEARAQKKLRRKNQREKMLSVAPGEEPLYDVKVESFDHFESFSEGVMDRTPSFEDHDMSSPIDHGPQIFEGLNHFLAPCFNGATVNEQPSPHILGSVDIHLITSCVQAALSPMMARFEAFQEKVESRMEQLEGKVSSRLELLEAKVNVCLEKLSNVAHKPRVDIGPDVSGEEMENERTAGSLRVVCDLTDTEVEMVTETSLSEASSSAEGTTLVPGANGFALQEMSMDLKPFVISEREYELMEKDDQEVQIKDLTEKQNVKINFQDTD